MVGLGDWGRKDEFVVRRPWVNIEVDKVGILLLLKMMLRGGKVMA